MRSICVAPATGWHSHPASDAAQTCSLPDPGPDRAAIMHWISGTPVRDGRTYRGGARAGPGARADGGPAGRGRRCWTPRYTTPLQAPRKEHVARVRAAVARGGRLCADSSARVSVLLSGGLDSSAIAAVASRRPGRAPTRRSLQHSSIDESELIDVVAQALGLGGQRMAVRGGSMLSGAIRHAARWRMPLKSQDSFYFWSRSACRR